MPSLESQIKTAADNAQNRFGKDVITDRYEFRGDITPVSYTHLDVYKRQLFIRSAREETGASGLFSLLPFARTEPSGNAKRKRRCV